LISFFSFHFISRISLLLSYQFIHHNIFLLIFFFF